MRARLAKTMRIETFWLFRDFGFWGFSLNPHTRPPPFRVSNFHDVIAI